jgi:transposase
VLNYKYEIFPTAPQRLQLNKILRQTKLQWNRAVTIRKKLKAALIAGQFEHVIKECLSAEKRNTQGKRAATIRNKYPELDFDMAARLYDIENLVGKVLEIDERRCDINCLADELKEKHKSELAKRKTAKKDGVGKKLPKLSAYWQLRRAIDRYSGFAAKTFMDKSFKSPKDMSLSSLRFNISGSGESEVKWNRAVNPTQQQRAFGAKGEPRYKRRGEGFTYQETAPIEELIRQRRNNGHLINISALSKEMRWLPFAYHRPIPENSKVKQLTINSRAERYFAVFSVDVPESAWAIAPMNAGWHAGIDPGAQTALTIALKNSENGELRHLAIHYEFLEKSLGKLEKLQQALTQKQGPMRVRTEEEIQEALKTFSAKSAIKKLPEDERIKEIAKKEKWLRSTKVRNADGMSNRWRRWAKRVSALQMKIGNQRTDVLHKISRALAEGSDLVGIGHWEPEREVSWRKKLRAAKKKVKMGIAGAAEELRTVEEEKSKQGPKGAKKKRRGGRDRSIATLRSLIDEKAKRASIKALTDINEASSTMTCCNCGAETGPKKDLSIRQWRCEKCNTLHHRDLNSGFNILKKTEMKIASAQEAAPETGPAATRTMAQGATGQSGRKSGLRATGPSGRGGSFFYGHDGNLPDLWDGEVPKALKSLFQMGIARSLTMQTGPETGPEEAF